MRRKGILPRIAIGTSSFSYCSDKCRSEILALLNDKEQPA
jgi:hypothetical protein